MIIQDMYDLYDWSEFQRRYFYGKLLQVDLDMAEWLIILEQYRCGHRALDFAITDYKHTKYISMSAKAALTGQDIFLKYENAMVEWLIEWCIGVKASVSAEILEMDSRYPELAKLDWKNLWPSLILQEKNSLLNRLKKWFKRI